MLDVGDADGLSGAANDLAILLVAHGSARYPEAGRPAAVQSARLQASNATCRTAYGLLNGAPSVAESLAVLDTAEIRVVPFFMEEGYFTRVAVSKAVGADPRVRLCPPVGVHDRIASLITDHAWQGCAGAGLNPTATALLIVGHGSARAPRKALALRRHVSELARREAFAVVRAAYLEEPPFLPDALADLRGWPVAVVGFFAGEGGHVRDDVPAALWVEQAARCGAEPPVHNFGSVADNPAMAQIILDQAGLT